jgi:peroxiredoxin
MMTRVALLLLLLASSGAWGADLKIGDAAPQWKGLRGVDHKEYSLDTFAKSDVLVVVFTCNSCPYAQDYEERIMALCKEHCGEGKKAALVAINANKVKEDQPDTMKARATKRGFNYPYVWDETQEVARAHGAKWTPEFYVFDKDRKLIYRGALDDNADPAKAKTNYVALAIEAALAGKSPEVTEAPAVGCAVRYERKRGK